MSGDVVIPTPGPLLTLEDVQRNVLAAIATLTQHVTDLDVKLDQLTASSAASAAQLSQDIAQLRDNLLGLSRAISRAPDGESLINVVGRILNKVNSL